MTDNSLPTQAVVTEPVVPPQALTDQTPPEPADTPVEEWDKERAAATIKAQREKEKVLKERLKKLEALEAEDAKRKEAEMTELQKAQARAEKAEAEAAELRLTTLRRQIADEVGLPPVLAARLQGATAEEMTEDAKKLLEALPKETNKPKPKVTNPGDNSQVESLEAVRKRREAHDLNPWDLGLARQLGGGVVASDKE